MDKVSTIGYFGKVPWTKEIYLKNRSEQRWRIVSCKTEKKEKKKLKKTWIGGGEEGKD